MPFIIDGTTGFNLPSGADLTVNGNFTVSGTTTTISTETLTVDDNIIVLNNNEAGTPSENAGIEVERGTSTNVSIRWNETTDKWQFTNDGITYTDIGAGGDVVDDTTPQLGGDLDINNNNITGTGNINVTGHLSVGGVHQLASYLSGSINGDIFRVGSNSSVNMKVNVGGSGVRIMASSGRELRLLSDGDTTEKGIVVASDGNVGVGTESPTAKLSVVGNIGLNATTAPSDPASGEAFIYTTHTSGNTGIRLHASGSSEVLEVRSGSSTTDLFKLNNQGNATFQGEVSASYFVDRNNTSYYLDPGSSTTSLNVNGKVFSGSSYHGASEAEIITSPIRKHSNTISTNTTIASTENAISSGPITIANSVTVTVDGDWTVV